MNTLLLFGGMDDDYEQIVVRDQTEKTIEWEFLKDTRCGDRLLIYFNQPHSAILATAVALEDAWQAKSGNFRGRMGQIRLLKDPITFAELRFRFPNWRWLKYARSKLYLDKEKALALWNRAQGTSPDTFRRWRNQGAGFGDPETNRKVEQAAVKRVRKELIASGHEVVSREKDREGYDLDATKNGTTWHVEVKGISGDELGFVITRGEWNRACEDPHFILFAVTNARRAGAARLHRFTGKQIVAQFSAVPLSYFARLK